MKTYDLHREPLRELNAQLHALPAKDETESWKIVNPRGQHAVAVGVDTPVRIDIEGSVGYFCGGMNNQAHIVINGNAGQGVGENMESGRIHVTGDASQSAGATGRGGLLVIDGNASARCGISMKGVDIVVKGDVGHLSAFMGQTGRLVVFGDAGEALGDSIYEARIYVRGKVASLGADCIEKEMRDEHRAELAELIASAGVQGGHAAIGEFRRYGSARKLYNFHVDNAGAY